MTPKKKWLLFLIALFLLLASGYLLFTRWTEGQLLAAMEQTDGVESAVCRHLHVNPFTFDAYLTGVERKAKKVTASWEATQDDGGEEVSYILTATPVGSKAARRLPKRTCTTTALSCTLRKIDPTVTYRLTLVARNVLGDSAPDTQVSNRLRR